ncbi:MAG: allophanate hydrolase subunit 1 [Planctomycetota bacterium]
MKPSSKQQGPDRPGTDIIVRWLGAECAEFQIRMPANPRLFLALHHAAADLRGPQYGAELGVCQAVAAYRAIAVYWKTPPADPSQVIRRIRNFLRRHLHDALADDPVPSSRDAFHETPAVHALEIPVCYDGPDLSVVARSKAMTIQEVIRLHTSTTYTVAAIGFQAHFGYLWGLPISLHTPRRASPRTMVPAGSVGIGGSQTGFYPSASPGGWQIIGSIEPTFAQQVSRAWQVGDQVRFVATTSIPAPSV